MSVGPPVEEVTPQMLAALLRARTKDNEGREVGLWTEATRPTIGQVEEIIDLARGIVAGAFGAAGDTCAAAYEQVVGLQAALLIELSYFPEQVRSERSPYVMLERLYNQAVEGYQACVTEHEAPAAAGGVYSILTPSLPVTALPKQVINWNDPHAEDIDDPPNPPWWPPHG